MADSGDRLTGLVTGRTLPRLRVRSPLARFILRRIALGVVVLWVASVLIFVGTSVLPGNAARAILGRYATTARVKALEVELHLNQPLPEQYWRWISHFIRGDLGRSAISVVTNDSQSTIASTIAQPLLNTAILAGITAAILIPLSMMLGAWSAFRAGKPDDHIVAAVSIGGISLPEFVTASLLISTFAVGLHWLPPVALIAPGQTPLDAPNELVLPVLTLLVATLALAIRMIRANMIEVLGSEYVLAARLGGVSSRRMVWSYGLRNALAPSVVVYSLCLQYLVGGIVITETVFDYPGIGKLLVSAVTVRDINTVQSVALILAAIYVALNICADVLVIALVPRLRTSS